MSLGLLSCPTMPALKVGTDHFTSQVCSISRPVLTPVYLSIFKRPYPGLHFPSPLGEGAVGNVGMETSWPSCDNSQAQRPSCTCPAEVPECRRWEGVLSRPGLRAGHHSRVWPVRVLGRRPQGEGGAGFIGIRWPDTGKSSRVPVRTLRTFLDSGKSPQPCQTSVSSASMLLATPSGPVTCHGVSAGGGVPAQGAASRQALPLTLCREVALFGELSWVPSPLATGLQDQVRCHGPEWGCWLGGRELSWLRPAVQLCRPAQGSLEQANRSNLGFGRIWNPR